MTASTKRRSQIFYETLIVYRGAFQTLFSYGTL